jgi:hypothetical protein
MAPGGEGPRSGGYQAAIWSRQIASGIPPWFHQLLGRSAWQWQDDGDGRTHLCMTATQPLELFFERTTTTQLLAATAAPAVPGNPV